jgi:hypothetical protein
MTAETCSVVFLENKVKKYKERCVKTDLYFILNYLYPHRDGEIEKKSK